MLTSWLRALGFCCCLVEVRAFRAADNKDVDVAGRAAGLATPPRGPRSVEEALHLAVGTGVRRASHALARTHVFRPADLAVTMEI